VFYDKFSVKGKKVAVTGGSQGIGKCIAEILSDCGASVGILDINGEKAKQTAQSIGKDVIAITCDVTDPVQVTSSVDEFVSHFGRLDAVFNNAGIVIHKPAEETSPEEFRKVLDVNLNGVFYVAQAAAKEFIRAGTGGSIVNTASMSGTIVNIPQCQASYNASKAAVVHLSKSLAVEWAAKGIRVNSISPGYIATEMTGSVREDWRDFWTGLIPFRRMGTPEELAGAVIYLMSDASSYTSGADIIIDGCFTCI
jgi:NAD(P)-dependent dehydrogenase (short-subunit alcohol dehydrogenase family)